jgi:hypothetical protein
MTFSIPSLFSCRGRFWRPLCLGLSTALAATASGMSVQHSSCPPSGFKHSAKCSSEPQAYLLILGPSGFRFAPAPAAYVERPAAVIVPSAITASPVIEKTPVATKAVDPHSLPAAVANGPKPLPILNDDTPRDLHAEDILPFFQLPRNDGSTRSAPEPFAPSAPTQPASSASYELK